MKVEVKNNWNENDKRLKNAPNLFLTPLTGKRMFEKRLTLLVHEI